MKNRILITVMTLGMAATLPSVSVAQVNSLDQLLNLVEQGRARDNREAQQREREFQAGPGRAAAAC